MTFYFGSPSSLPRQDQSVVFFLILRSILSFQYRFSFFHSLSFSFSFFFCVFGKTAATSQSQWKRKKKERTRLVYDIYVIDQACGQIFAKSVFFSIFVHFEYWLTEIKSSSIKTAACVTSVSVWFWIKERPGNGIFGIFARKETRAILHRPLPPLPALLLTPFLARSLTLVPRSFPRTARKLNACCAGYENMRT